MQSKVEICGVNTSGLKTLRQEEMARLLPLAQKGDREAQNRLVEGNLRLVLSVTQRFMGRGENPDDLFQVGCIGLLKAVQNFDATKEVRFSTYGVPMSITLEKKFVAYSISIGLGTLALLFSSNKGIEYLYLFI